MSQGTITLWIAQLKSGNRNAADEAFREIWNRYYKQLADFAQRKLNGRGGGMADNEDVLQSAFRLAFERARNGKMADVHDRDDLWHMLIRITAFKARDQVRKQTRQKRGGSAPHEDVNLDDAAVTLLTPEVPVMLAEQLQVMLDRLGAEDSTLRIVAEMKLEGADKRTIQERLQCSPRTVERKLRRIREIWISELDS